MVQENCQRQRIPRTHSEAGTNPQDRWSQWRTSWWTGRRVSTDTNHRWRGSPCRFLVDPRWLHLSSSQWTTGSTLRAEGRNISHPTEIYWWNLVYSYWTGCVTREANRRLQEWRLGQIFVRLMERTHEIHSIHGKRNLQKDWQRFKQLPDQIMKGQKFGRKVVKPVRIERYKNGQKKNRSSTMLENERNLLYWSRGRRIQRNSQECEEKLERPVAPTMPCKKPPKSIKETCVNQVTGKPNGASEENSKTMFGWKVESRGSTRQRAESSESKNHEDHIASKGFTSMP